MVIITGDVHADWGRLNALISKKHPEILIVCGDFGYWPSTDDFRRIKPDGTKILWCDGNHEEHWALRDLIDPEIMPGVFYMGRGSVYILPDNRRVLFMGGANSTDKESRKFGIDWFPEETINWADMENLPDHRIDIVISHTCPEEFYEKLVSRGDNDPSRVALSNILEKYKPALWFFGHFHMYKRGKFGDTWWTALNMAGNTGWWITLK